ncbi:type II secretion system F family protein [Acuticoccus sp. I52.16.1]|uniref:type II secretion system F family protein n=1 Tax=Acuticoccus sp. I52.16.1 TaxID=2928472 RepID=UPI001FD541C8|nr:type II secretion system F family protein [Acuticoccus sp. I52.16.1]UOM34664.1 type II secretion system F family protein [Acuticoccus sp. I52.16.1]
MERFEYRAIDASGNLAAGAIEAASVADAYDALARSGLTPLDARKVAGTRPWRERMTPDPRPEHVTAFTADLAMLLKGGVQLNEALKILADLETRAWLRRLTATLSADISAGRSFSEALARHPREFPPVYAKTVEVAEAAGRLEEALSGLAAERARAEAMRRKVVAAVAYPLFLVVAALGVLGFVLLYVIPQFEGAIAGFRDQMDPAALLVFDLSAAFRAHVDLVAIASAVVLVAGLAVKRLGEARALWLALAARLPVTRTIVSHAETMAFCRTLAILTDNGVDISTALRLIRGVLARPGAGRRVDAVTAEVRQGRRLSDALAQEALMPSHVTQMLRIGEEAGELGPAAGRVAAFYELKLEAALTRLTGILGPALMILVSLLIAWVIISVMSALIGINDLLV